MGKLHSPTAPFYAQSRAWKYAAEAVHKPHKFFMFHYEILGARKTFVNVSTKIYSDFFNSLLLLFYRSMSSHEL